MFGSGPFSHADTWGDLPRMQQAAENNIRDPALKGSWIDGWQQATQNTPEARELADRLAEYRQLPSQAQAELTGQREAVSSRGSARDILSAQRYWLMRQIAFAPLGVGMAAHHPALAMAMGGIWLGREGVGAFIRSHPDMYLSMLRAAASPTARGLRQGGYYAGRLAMYDLARYLREQQQK